MDGPRREARGVIGNIGSLTAGELLSRVLALAATVVLARRLGPESYGLFAYATSLAWYLTCGVRAGLTLVTAALHTGWVYKGLEQSGRVALSLMLREGLFLLLVVVAVQAQEDVALAAAALVVA